MVTIDLLQQVYKYYPIGNPGYTLKYPGYHLHRAIIEDKMIRINNLQYQDWLSVEHKVLEHFSEQQLIRMGGVQFGSWELSIKTMSEFSGDHHRLSTYIHCCVSLLTNHYTIFFEDTSELVPGYHLNKFVPPTQTVLAMESHWQWDQYKKAIEDIKKGIEIAFPAYQFVPHDVLFNAVIDGGIPYGYDIMDEPKPRPLYNFLFSGTYSPLNPTIFK